MSKKIESHSAALRCVTLLLVIVFMLGALVSCGGAPKADDASGTSGNFKWEYKKDDQTLTISGNGKMEDAAKPENVAWYGVRSSVKKLRITGENIEIGNNAFFFMPYLESVEMPKDNVLKIGDKAFAYCSSLKSIAIPSSVTAIGDSAFEGCVALAQMTVPTSVESIGERAFAFCHSLSTLTIKGTPKTGEQLFLECEKLEKVIVPTAFDENSFAKNAFEGTSMTTEKVKGSKIDFEAEYTLTVKYVDENGKEIEPAKVEKKKAGESYNETAKDIEGYDHADKDQKNAAGTMTKNVEVTFKYKKIPVVEDTATDQKEQEPTDPWKTALTLSIFGVAIIAVVVVAVIVVKSNKKQAAGTKKGGSAGGRRR